MTTRLPDFLAAWCECSQQQGGVLLRDLRPDLGGMGLNAAPPPAQVLVAQHPQATVLGCLTPPQQFPARLNLAQIPLTRAVHASVEDGELITEAQAVEMLGVGAALPSVRLSRMEVHPLTDEETQRAMAVSRASRVNHLSLSLFFFPVLLHIHVCVLLAW